MAWATNLFYGLNDKTGPVTRLAPNTDEETEERISASTSSYTMESNEDTFKPDVIFESFHHQTRVQIPNRALLAGFLIIWLKRRVVQTLPHEVIVTDVVYPAVLLAHGWSIALPQQWWAAFKVDCECRREASVRWKLLWIKMASPNLKCPILESSCHTHI